GQRHGLRVDRRACSQPEQPKPHLDRYVKGDVRTEDREVDARRDDLPGDRSRRVEEDVVLVDIQVRRGLRVGGDRLEECHYTGLIRYVDRVGLASAEPLTTMVDIAHHAGERL